MELFIRIENGAPVEHPIFGDNFRQAFPDVDVNNLPNWVARFERVPAPLPGEYQKLSLRYGWVNGTVQDIWELVEMTAEERAEADRVKAESLALQQQALQRIAADAVMQMNKSGMEITRV